MAKEKKKEESCAYCGKQAESLTRDHIVPKCIYPKGVPYRDRLATLACCERCNKEFAKFEDYFKTFLVAAGGESQIFELLKPSLIRGLTRENGKRLLATFLSNLQELSFDGKPRHLVFPGEVQQVRLGVKKVIRGLAVYHGIQGPIPNEAVHVNLLLYEIPEYLLAEMDCRKVGNQVFEYYVNQSYENPCLFESTWILKFFGRVSFAGVIFPFTRCSY